MVSVFIRAGITPRPDSTFMMQVGRNLTDPLDGFVRGKRLLILDRYKKFTTEFRDLLKHAVLPPSSVATRLRAVVQVRKRPGCAPQGASVIKCWWLPRNPLVC